MPEMQTSVPPTKYPVLPAPVAYERVKSQIAGLAWQAMGQYPGLGEPEDVLANARLYFFDGYRKYDGSTALTTWTWWIVWRPLQEDARRAARRAEYRERGRRFQKRVEEAKAPALRRWDQDEFLGQLSPLARRLAETVLAPPPDVNLDCPRGHRKGSEMFIEVVRQYFIDLGESVAELAKACKEIGEALRE